MISHAFKVPSACARSPYAQESRPYDFKSDVWAMGCIIFEMSSLKHAFDAQDMNGKESSRATNTTD